MQNASSYMVPKLVLANVLAVIMMTFEQHAPAETPQKPQSAVDDKAVIGKEATALDVADARPPQAAKASAVPKKRLYKVRHSERSRAQLTHASAPGPIECCFRGYKS